MKYAILLLTIISVGCTKKNDVTSDIVSVGVGDVVQQVSLVGRVRAEHTALLRSPIDGQLVKLYKSLGDTVTAGEPIAALEQPKNEMRLSGINEDEGKLNQIRLRKNQVELKIASLKKELDRASRLLASGSVAVAERDNAKMSYELSLKERESLNLEEKTAQNSYRLKVDSQKSSARLLAAPSSGLITQLWVPEEDVTQGMSIPKDTIIATIEEPGRYIMRGDVVEADYIRLQIGQGVQVALVHDPAATWPGKIKSISPIARQDQFGIGRFEVSAVFAVRGPPLKTGLEAQSQIILQKKQNVLRLPRSAVFSDGKQYFASSPAVEGPNPIKIPIQIGLVGDEYVEVVSGLTSQQKVYGSYVSAHR